LFTTKARNQPNGGASPATESNKQMGEHNHPAFSERRHPLMAGKQREPEELPVLLAPTAVFQSLSHLPLT